MLSLHYSLHSKHNHNRTYTSGVSTGTDAEQTRIIVNMVESRGIVDPMVSVEINVNHFNIISVLTLN